MIRDTLGGSGDFFFRFLNSYSNVFGTESPVWCGSKSFNIFLRTRSFKKILKCQIIKLTKIYQNIFLT